MFEFVIKPDVGDPFKLSATSRDVYLWEKTSKMNMSSLQTAMSMTAMYEIAHFAAKRQHLFTGSLQEFTNSCDIDFEAQVVDVDPTQPEA